MEPIRIYMGGLILGVNRFYACFLRLNSVAIPYATARVLTDIKQTPTDIYKITRNILFAKVTFWNYYLVLLSRVEPLDRDAQK